MAEVVYKKISELDNATVPLTGIELVGVSANGVSKKATIEGMHGAGWWNALKAALSSFVAPEATHAVDSDTCGEESPEDFHDAAQLTGAIHLDRIPVELTGKNAATSDLADVSTNALSLGGSLANVHAKVYGAGASFSGDLLQLYGVEFNTSTGAITGVKYGGSLEYTVPVGRMFIGSTSKI